MRKNLILLLGSLLIALPAMAQNTFLADRHVTKNINCTACHESQTPAPGAQVTSGKCIQCHGTLENIAVKTKNKKLDPDPHYNHLVNTDCQECHKGHGQSTNVCANCHNLQYKVP